MECWSWAPCGQDYYVAQLPVDDGLGFLVQPLQCRLLTAPSQTKRQYKLVDGERTRDRDNVWMDCTQCDPSSQYQASPCTLASDAVCLPRLFFCFRFFLMVLVFPRGEDWMSIQSLASLHRP